MQDRLPRYRPAWSWCRAIARRGPGAGLSPHHPPV